MDRKKKKKKKAAYGDICHTHEAKNKHMNVDYVHLRMDAWV